MHSKIMDLSETVRSYPRKIKERLPVAMGASATFLPVGAFLETMAYGMDNIESVQARCTVAAYTALVLPAIEDIRDISRRQFNCTEDNKKQKAHDLLLYLPVSAAFTAAVYQGLPTLSGGEALAYGAATAIVGAAAGLGLLASGKQFKKALEPKNSPQRSFARRWAAGVATASIIATGAVYAGNQPQSVDDSLSVRPAVTNFQYVGSDSFHELEREEKHVHKEPGVRD